MKISIVLFCFILIYILPRNVFGKNSNYFIQPQKIEQEPKCYSTSNKIYNECMSRCVSTQSPPEIVEGCFFQCIPKANNYYYNCLLKKGQRS